MRLPVPVVLFASSCVATLIGAIVASLLRGDATVGVGALVGVLVGSLVVGVLVWLIIEGRA